MSATTLFTATTRRHDLDWLRVIAFAVLIFYHVGMFYVTWGWHVKSDHASPLLEPAMALVNPWRLALLFFISGVAIRFAADARSFRRLLPERTGRLLAPLAFGMLVVVMPQAYLELLFKGEIEPGLIAFYPRYLAMDGSFSIITPTWNHLWYVAYILVYTLLLAALSPLLGMAERRFGDRTAALLERGAWPLLVLPALPFVLYRLTLDPAFPTTHAMIDDWATHAHSFTMLLLGWFAAKSPAFRVAVERTGRAAALVAAATGIALLLARLYWPDLRTIDGAIEAIGVLRAFYGWTVILVLLALAQRLLNRPSPALAYMSEAVFPWYILHQTIIVMVGYATIGAGLPAWLEGSIVVLATVLGCLVLHEFVIRRVFWLRPLFGLKGGRAVPLPSFAIAKKPV